MKTIDIIKKNIQGSGLSPITKIEIGERSKHLNNKTIDGITIKYNDSLISTAGVIYSNDTKFYFTTIYSQDYWTKKGVIE